MKLHQLQVFLSVVEQGSLHGAARALNLSPPAITVTIRELEKLLGVPLITRSVNGVKLTEYGALFRATGAHRTSADLALPVAVPNHHAAEND